MKNYFHCLIMLFIYSGLYLLINGEEAGSTKETSSEHPSVDPYPYKSSPFATATMPNILFAEDYNYTGSRYDRLGLSGCHRKNHRGQPIRRKGWRTRTQKLKSRRRN